MSVTGMCWTDEEDQSLFLSMSVHIQFLYCGRNLQERNLIQAPQSILPFLSLKENTNWGGVRALNILVGCNGPDHLLLALLPFLSTWVKSTIATQFKASSPGLSCAVVIPVLRCLSCSCWDGWNDLNQTSHPPCLMVSVQCLVLSITSLVPLCFAAALHHGSGHHWLYCHPGS